MRGPRREHLIVLGVDVSTHGQELLDELNVAFVHRRVKRSLAIL
jgi:hypothetical protein